MLLSNMFEYVLVTYNDVIIFCMLVRLHIKVEVKHMCEEKQSNSMKAMNVVDASVARRRCHCISFSCLYFN